MLLRQFPLRNDLPTYIEKIQISFWEKPRKLLSAKANFEGCD